MNITFELLANSLLAGLLLGGFYAALSAGATIAFGLLEIVNIAHPTFAVIGAYAVYLLNRHLHLDPLLGGLVLTPIFYLIGTILYRVYHFAFERRSEDAMQGLAFFFGLMFIVEVGLIMIFGVDFRYVTTDYITTTWQIGELSVPLRLAVPFVGSLALLAVLEIGLKRSFTGRAIIAVAEDPLALRLMSASPVKIKRIAFGVAIATTAFVGALLVIIQPLQPASGREFIGRVFAICVLGGMGSISGTLIAAVFLGLVENMTSIFLGASWSPAVAFGFLLITLAVRPRGLLGR
ncbi:MAG TPA: branched-chain amino acid ABC transporter permease [Stellaceae bacterium]